MNELLTNITIENQTDLKPYNDDFRGLTHKQRLTALFDLYNPEDILVTTSFGTKSILLLELIHEINPSHPIYFVNTGYHFEETLDYREELVKQYNLNLVELHPHHGQHELTTEEEWWIDHPKMCCTINKIAPLQPVIEEHKLWVSSLMSYQTPYRSHMDIFQKQGGIIKFQPFIDLEESGYTQWVSTLSLPLHPLLSQGYNSIGCTHCTAKGQGRSGRWTGKEKTECGLHLKYFPKPSN